MSSQEKKIRQKARYWVTEITSGEVTPESLDCFNHWIQEDFRHKKTYQQVESVFLGLSDIERLNKIEPLESLTLQERIVSLFNESLMGMKPLFSPIRISLAITVMIIAVTMTFYNPLDKTVDNDFVTTNQYRTNVGQVKDIILADGSQIKLGAKSALLVNFSKNERQLRLLHGQAFFNVFKQPERPFNVLVGETVVTAVGTRFDIRKGVSEINVGVEEGIVEVTHYNNQGKKDNKTVKLIAGQYIKSPINEKKQKHQSRKIQLASVNAFDGLKKWRVGHMIYVDSPLKEIINDINRYHHNQILITSETVANLRLTTAFRVEQITDTLAALESALPIKLVKGKNNTIFIQPHQD